MQAEDLTSTANATRVPRSPIARAGAREAIATERVLTMSVYVSQYSSSRVAGANLSYASLAASDARNARSNEKAGSGQASSRPGSASPAQSPGTDEPADVAANSEVTATAAVESVSQIDQVASSSGVSAVSGAGAQEPTASPLETDSIVQDLTVFLPPGVPAVPAMDSVADGQIRLIASGGTAYGSSPATASDVGADAPSPSPTPVPRQPEQTTEQIRADLSDLSQEIERGLVQDAAVAETQLVDRMERTSETVEAAGRDEEIQENEEEIMDLRVQRRQTEAELLKVQQEEQKLSHSREELPPGTQR